MDNKIVDKMLKDIKTVKNNKSKYTIKTCTKCNKKYYMYEDNKEDNICPKCKVIIDMHLPKDTIVNQCLIYIWQNKLYDENEGIDDIYCKICEGVMLFDNPSKRSKKTGLKFLTSQTNENIEEYIVDVLEKYNGYFDGVVVVRNPNTQKFDVCLIRLGDNIFYSIKDKSNFFKKVLLQTMYIDYVEKERKK